MKCGKYSNFSFQRLGHMAQQFGKFKLLKKIASGGMAEIHIAKQRGMEGFEKIVVIKTILPNLASNEEFVQMFLDEARIAARLTHPNIVQIYDLGRVGSTYFIAMEYVQGENLRTVAKACRKKKAPLPLQHTVKVISQASEGLHYAHSKQDTSGAPLNIVHRDISPQNILVSFEGITKLVDFGIAKAATQYQETRAGILKGKYSYMSPEQCMSRPVDARSDIFSMGIVLWELATGLRLYKLDSELMILKEITEGKVRPPRDVNQQIPAELEAIILKALEKRPKDRFSSALEMHMALEEFMKNQGLISSTVHLSAFMRELFKDKLENLRKIEQAQADGDNLESFLFDDLNEPDMYVPGTGATPSQVSPVSTPSKPLFPKPTTGISRIAPVPSPTAPVKPRRNLFAGSIIIVLLGILGTLAYFVYQQTKTPGKKVSAGDAGVPIAPSKGRIHVTSSPAGASVFLDGNRKGTTPCDIGDLPPGKLFALRISKTGFRPWKTQFKVEDAEPRPFHAQLEKVGTTSSGWGSAEVITAPPGASVTLDGSPVAGKTPLTLERVTVGESHQLVASLEGRKSWTKSFSVRAGRTIKLTGDLPRDQAGDSTGQKKRAYVSLRSRPGGASFFLNGSPVSSSFALEPGGSYLVSARLRGYKEWSQRISPRRGEHMKLVAKLVRGSVIRPQGKASLSLDCKPWAKVFLDNVEIGTTPIANHELKAGSHTIRLVNGQLQAAKKIKIVARNGESIRKNVEFAKGLLSVRAKPWADVYIHGKKLGTTPFEPKELYEGTYKVILKNPTLNLTLERKATIKPGEKTVINANFLN